MNLFDRMILTLYSLALTVLSIGAIAVLLRLIPWEVVSSQMEMIYYAGEMRYAYLVVAIIFFLMSLKFLFQGFKRSNDPTSNSIFQRTDLGNVSISVATMDTIALKAARRVRGVREVKTSIKADETGTSIVLKVSVDGETPIPEIINDIQKAVKQQVETVVGIEVKEVDVKVTEVANNQHAARLSRVE
ncbi:alkaline shock response membrane anchor protein AmaP [Ammoniphilus resinae]|uniref:Alkaline shock family protein YloU n=1 Tax=Ammoniphilus resinae TaxID=861532 RepID=A0ABS4GVA6_9BACL|nr:alkaline shock response membrane anchor protein AmaP [Ammoniphilus resinae]MBP1934184.1 putative alkaline shock family protein YloU [Ammoniphilus resinae]